MPEKKKAKKPLGDIIDWSDKDLDDLSAISQADLKAAMAIWENAAPASLKDLLKAKTDGDSNKTNE